MEILFWIFFGIGIALAIALIPAVCIRKLREQMIYLYINIGLATCSLMCSIINLAINY